MSDSNASDSNPSDSNALQNQGSRNKGAASEATMARERRYAQLEIDTPRLGQVQFYQRSRRSVLVGGLATLAGFSLFRGVQTADLVDRTPGPLRAVHEKNETLWRALFREDHLARTFDSSESSPIRVNGRKGLGEEFDPSTWELRVEGPDGELLGIHSMEDIRALAKVEHTIEHKCVEGWSHVITWGGARFSDLAGLYEDQLGQFPDYVDLRTPDGGYYVGVDLATMRHPQTLLTYEMQGEALEPLHGAPLRLTTPLKYGIKQIKRIGIIRFSHQQPADYWHERGYDWYAHL